MTVSRYMLMVMVVHLEVKGSVTDSESTRPGCPSMMRRQMLRITSSTSTKKAEWTGSLGHRQRTRYLSLELMQ